MQSMTKLELDGLSNSFSIQKVNAIKIITQLLERRKKLILYLQLNQCKQIETTDKNRDAR